METRFVIDAINAATIAFNATGRAKSHSKLRKMRKGCLGCLHPAIFKAVYHTIRKTLSFHNADPRGDLEASYREGIEIKNFLDEKREVFHVDFKSQPVDIPFVKKNLRDYDVVHYAGHGDYHSDNPAES